MLFRSRCVAEVVDGLLVSGSADKTLRVWGSDSESVLVLKEIGRASCRERV